MHDSVGALDGPCDGVTIGERRLDQLMGDALEIGEVADREIVEDADAIAALHQDARDRRADEPCPADDEDGPVQRRWASARAPAPAPGVGTQRTFWTNVAGSIRSRWAAIRSSIVSISSSFSNRGSSPSSRSFEC